MIDVDIVTPARKLLIGEKAESLTLPTSSGEIMVLPGHTDLVTVLGIGGMYLQSAGLLRKYVVSYGFAVVKKNKVTVLAETCEEAHEIDRDRAQLAEKKASEALVELLTGDALQKFQRKLRRAQVRAHVAGSSDKA